MRAFLNLRYTVEKRWKAFEAGLKSCGYEIHRGLTNKVKPGDIFVTWNRIGPANAVANMFEKHDLPVLVTENASWGNEFAGKSWYTIARARHNTAGCFPVGSPMRWDGLNINLPEWRTGGETVILPQRGIGSKPTAMPNGWAKRAQKRHGGRVRAHPGKSGGSPLEEDLAGCGKVITWGSGAAIKALLMGIPVTSEMPDWIAQQDNTDTGRLEMFRRLAWAQWTLEEIAAGMPFKRLL